MKTFTGRNCPYFYFIDIHITFIDFHKGLRMLTKVKIRKLQSKHSEI